MFKNISLLFLFSVFLFFYAHSAFANPIITSFLLNGSAQNLTFNPNGGKNISIEAKTDTIVKFTRLYICSINQACNGTSGNYTRYFSPNETSYSVVVSWDGKGVGDKEIVSEGEYKIMVSMSEGTNDTISLPGQYSIFVDFSIASSTPVNPNNNDTPTSTEKQNLSTNTAITRVVYVYSHSSPEDLSNYDDKVPFESTAGRERMALVGSPIEFDAKYNLLQKGECSPSFKWSYGDGFEGIGKDVGHTYKYQGEYQVVLNGSCGEYNSISRTVVKVYTPNISISNLPDGDIEVSNNGKTEINIGDWKIKGIEKDFIFPKDTIISVGNKIILSKEDLQLNASSSRLSLNNPSGREVTFIDKQSTEPVKKIQALETDSSTSIIEAESLIKEYKDPIVVKDKPIINIKEVDSDEIVNQTATVAEAASSSSTGSFWTRLVDIPIKGIKYFAHMFYDF
jgi:hypothetical protein